MILLTLLVLFGFMLLAYSAIGFVLALFACVIKGIIKLIKDGVNR